MNREPAFWRFVVVASIASLAAVSTLALTISALWKLGLLDIRF